MLKKIVLTIGIITSFYCIGHAVQDESTYQKVSISSESVFVPNLNQPRLVVFNDPGRGKKNCITDISFSVANFPTTATLYILDAGATYYALATTTGPVIESWYPENPLCLSQSLTTYMYISSGSFKINASGYVK